MHGGERVQRQVQKDKKEKGEEGKPEQEKAAQMAGIQSHRGGASCPE
jgi:hypothetical protein